MTNEETKALMTKVAKERRNQIACSSLARGCIEEGCSKLLDAVGLLGDKHGGATVYTHVVELLAFCEFLLETEEAGEPELD